MQSTQNFYQTELNLLYIIQGKIADALHMDNAEKSKFSWYFFFVYIDHTVLISWRATKVAHI